jgi:hypothetical protein
MAEHPPIWALLLGVVYLIGAAATFGRLVRVGRPQWDRRLLQGAAAVLWPVYWLVLPNRKAHYRTVRVRAGASAASGRARLARIAAAVRALVVVTSIRIVAFVGGVLAILVCALAALCALVVAVLTPARHLVRLKTFWLEPIPDLGLAAGSAHDRGPERLGRDIEVQR